MEHSIDNGKYGHITRQNSDIQYKIMLANLAIANEDGERNRLLRYQLAMKLVQMSKSEITLVEKLVEEDIDLTDQAIE